MSTKTHNNHTQKPHKNPQQNAIHYHRKIPQLIKNQRLRFTAVQLELIIGILFKPKSKLIRIGKASVTISSRS